uniref:Uncharacterized protein n=1 Tax=Ciona savignyi TaxID=51511 RepID=H2ZID7_CIOSA
MKLIVLLVLVLLSAPMCLAEPPLGQRRTWSWDSKEKSSSQNFEDLVEQAMFEKLFQ